MGVRYRWVGLDERRVIGQRALAGERLDALAREFGFTRQTMGEIRAEAYAQRRRVDQSPHRLSYEERVRIEVGIGQGESNGQIASAIGRDRSTVGREITRTGARGRYSARAAQRKSDQRCARPKVRKLAACPRLLRVVETWLREKFSPQQISARLRVEFPDDPEMRISHETIYLSLFVQARGELNRQLARHLRSGRAARRPHGRLQRGRIVDMVNISERPAEAHDRAVPGHWEGDLIMGKDGKSFVATLVERQTRYVLLADLQGDRGTHNVIRVLAERIGTLPAHLARSLTWDQGKELSAHAQFTVATGVPVYFCDPHSPWQRGSNENTNGLLRQYLPKGTDLSVHDQAALDEIARGLNGRPRQTLSWLTPAEHMHALLTGTTPTPHIRPLPGSSPTQGTKTN